MNAKNFTNSMNPKVFLYRKRKKRLEQGHPWVFQSEVERTEGDISPGQIVDIYNHQGAFLARAYANPQSQIIARVLTYREDEHIDASFVLRRVLRAWQYRQRFVQDATSCRVVFGEADFLPGLIVDKYGDYLVVQILSYGMEVMRPLILDALLEVFSPKGIYLRNDVPVRELEGLPQHTAVWYGEVPREIEILENGLKLLVDVYEGQKTGYFYDQRENRSAIRPLMTGWDRLNPDRPNETSDEHTRLQRSANPQSARNIQAFTDGANVLDCFCHTGSFTVHALHYGARHVTAVDISETAIDMARRNVALNGFADRADFEVANVFDFLQTANRTNELYDVVILDPPAFAKSKRTLESAIRGYKEINLRGLKLVRDGGYLVTASCSYHMLPEIFQQTILEAAFDAHKVLRLIHWAGAGMDHPEIAGVREGHYLKFGIYEVNSRT
ncbi:class I SAM-dependent rRNA methyltransferase [Alicyclobacillus tolerans]|uniref:class I SAM-dependent rRNA methyltransferase n=1 Tax=Alicyclobacillus tolerans TaxID=90970 RepID=UPI001F45377C|nr:class I SAM-dependent rRNA methyltransferase [Alicyclobacillus tolerans]MCF8566241.1 class I SAM-dependent rRNA methyltransferase [Alicyclobacillus tolerans]